MDNNDYTSEEFRKGCIAQWNATHPWRQIPPESPPHDHVPVIEAPDLVPDVEIPPERHYIPGPIRPIHVAIDRRNTHRRHFPNEGESGPSTQQFITEVLAEPAPFDTDFNRPNWTSVLEFVSKEGHIITEMPNQICTCINFINKQRGGEWEKINKMVCIIKEFTPNGMGDASVTLKDPTGTIGGSIHRKVWERCENAQSIGVGAVLILKKVTVAKFGMREKYINITAKNIVAVVGKNEMIPNPVSGGGGQPMGSEEEDTLLLSTIVPDSEDEM